jgi:hypothetical protein
MLSQASYSRPRSAFRDGVLIAVILASMSAAWAQTAPAPQKPNAFAANAFPGRVGAEVFSLPLESGETLVVVPDALAPRLESLRAGLKGRTGRDVPAVTVSSLDPAAPAAKHLILLGNIADNPRLLDLYRRRLALADAYFPGAGGVLILPVASPWAPGKWILTIGVSREADLVAGWDAFLERLPAGAASIPPLRFLRTKHIPPTPPAAADVAALFATAEKFATNYKVYHPLVNWSLLYALTGNPRWAELVKSGYAFLLGHAARTGRWVPEPWSSFYFEYFDFLRFWRLIRHDPVFSLEDRKTVEEVLWGFYGYARSKPYLDAGFLPPGEPRQNHSTFLALSLYEGARYYSEVYGMTGFEAELEKVRRTFDEGQGLSSRPNDDGGGGYQILAPLHHILYTTGRGDDSYLTSGRLRGLVDLLVATFDNRRDPVSFGDIGTYSRRPASAVMPDETKFFSLAAWAYREPAYGALVDWLSGDAAIDWDSRGPLASGLYAVDLPPGDLARWTGVFPVLLDDAALAFSARRSTRASHLPAAGAAYVDKLSFRPSFDPRDEYLLLDGTSTFAHGHLDGNTVSRLTWRDRAWLVDAHYIRDVPSVHNGVVIARDGEQTEPPPLTSLDTRADFGPVGATRTAVRDWNGADWERTIVWEKRGWFLFLDRVTARRSGLFRLDARWRTRGEARLEDNALTVRQGDGEFFVLSADGAPRRLDLEPDVPLGRIEDGWNATAVCLARRERPLAEGGSWTFASLMFPGDESGRAGRDLLRVRDGLWLVRDGSKETYIGLRARDLADFGIATDGTLFAMEGGTLRLLDARSVRMGDAVLEGSRPFHCELDLGTASGRVDVPDGPPVLVRVEKIRFADRPAHKEATGGVVSLEPGRHAFVSDAGTTAIVRNADAWRRTAARVLPESWPAGPRDFGLEVAADRPAGTEITASTPAAGGLLFGDGQGRIFRADEQGAVETARLPSGKAVLCLAAADIDGDGAEEILAGGADETLRVFKAGGRLLWEAALSSDQGPNANATSISLADLDGRGRLTVFAATNGWALFAFHPDGRLRWRSFVYYHALTKVGMLKGRDGRPLVAVGTIYQTPLNVLTAEGRIKWFAWEQVGSESLSTTEYLGKNLRDMIFLDADGDGADEIVFGNEHGTVTAVEAEDGQVVWQAQLGDGVTALASVADPKSGACFIFAATEAGELYKLAARGGRLGWTTLESGITAISVIPYTAERRVDIVLGTVDGRLIVLDQDFVPRAAGTAGGPVQLVHAGAAGSDGTVLIHVAHDHGVHVFRYRPYFLRPSRHY